MPQTQKYVLSWSPGEEGFSVLEKYARIRRAPRPKQFVPSGSLQGQRQQTEKRVLGSSSDKAGFSVYRN